MLRSRRIRDERGQALPFVILCLIVLIGFASLAIDLGRVWVAKQQLQQAVDASAVAAGQFLPSSANAYSAAVSYSACGASATPCPGGKNKMGGYGVAVQPAGVTFKCVANGPNYSAGACPADTSVTNGTNNSCHPQGANQPPGGATTCNAVTVTESATVSSGFLSLFLPKFTINASSTSGARDSSSVPNPMNIEVILDTTGSMTDTCNAQLTNLDGSTVTQPSTFQFSGRITAGSATVTNVTGLNGNALTNGDAITGTGIQSNTTIVSVSPLMLSKTATATRTTNFTDNTSTPVSPDKLDCAKEGVRALLQAMPYTTVNNTPTADDDVGIVVFPALSSTLTGTTGTTYTQVGNLTGTATSGSKTLSVTASASAYVGDYISGTGAPLNGSVPTYTIVSAATGGTRTRPTYSVTLSGNATAPSNNAPYTIYTSGTSTGAPYSMASPATASVPSAALADETDCTGSDHFAVTYPPWSLAGSGGGVGGIPGQDIYPYGTTYSAPGIVDNYQGYQAIPITGSYLDAAGDVDPASSLVKSVYWSQCTNGQYTSGDAYGIKDIDDQGSYLAGAITAAQYQLNAPGTRTTGPNGQPVTNAIIILSDGEFTPNGMYDPDGSSDGVDFGANGNLTWKSTQPCRDAVNAAQEARANGTLIFTIAYDDSGQSCKDNTGGYNTSAQALMAALATPSTPTLDYSYTDAGGGAGDLTNAFKTAAQTLIPGDSRLIPDCGAGVAPPNC